MIVARVIAFLVRSSEATVEYNAILETSTSTLSTGQQKPAIALSETRGNPSQILLIQRLMEWTVQCEFAAHVDVVGDLEYPAFAELPVAEERMRHQAG